MTAGTIDDCADACLLDDRCLGFYYRITGTAPGATQCTGLSSLGTNTNGVKTSQNSTSWTKVVQRAKDPLSCTQVVDSTTLNQTTSTYLRVTLKINTCAVCTSSQYEQAQCSEFADAVCAPLRVCSAAEYQSVAPTYSTGRMCAPVSSCKSGEYQVAAPTATSDRVCAAISVCATGQYQSRPWTATSDRICTAVSTCGSGFFVAVPATAFSDVVCRAVSTCLANQYEALAPTASSDRVCLNVRSCIALPTCGGESPFVSIPIEGGDNDAIELRSSINQGICDNKQSGIFLPTGSGCHFSCATCSGSTSKDCTSCRDGSNPLLRGSVLTGTKSIDMPYSRAYESSTLSAFRFALPLSQRDYVLEAYLVFRPHNNASIPIPAGLQIAVELAGNSGPYTGQRFDLSSRVKSSPLNWFADVWAANTEMTPEVSALVNNIISRADWQYGNYLSFFVQQPSDLDQRTVRSATSVDGTLDTRQVPYLVLRKGCSVTAVTQFEFAAPTATTDRQCAYHTTCDAGEYEAKTATTTADRRCLPYTACSCTEYEFSAPTQFADRICKPVTPCGFDEVEYAAPTATSDRVCVYGGGCASDEFEAVQATFSSARVCAKITSCSAEQFEIIPQSRTTDRVCQRYVACDFPLQYESAAGTRVSDRVCAPVKICIGGTQYQSVAASPTSDAVCSALRICNSAQFQTLAPTYTSDRVCGLLRVCTLSEYQATGATATSDRVLRSSPTARRLSTSLWLPR